MKKVILASRSPRRKELFEHIGWDFEIRSKDVQEDFPKDMQVAKVPVFLAEKKASAFIPELSPEEVLVTADTVVVSNEQILGKPSNGIEAELTLQNLSGRPHEVMTGVCIANQNRKHSFVEKTKVYFKKFSTREINFYIEKYKPFDKAGGYGIQEWLGMIGVEKIEGCYYNVVGLPVSKLYQEMQKFMKEVS